jgi:hypothetical protein
MVRLIESSDASSFRELALLYLSAAGYSDPELRDGTGDLGNDISVWRLGMNPEPVVIQISVQRSGWQSKIRKDAQRSADILGYRTFVYMTSRRLAAADTSPLVDELWSRQNVTLRVVDCQTIASKFYVDGRSLDALRALAITDLPQARERAAERTSVREELAYAYAFFGTDVASFRDTAVERSIVAFLTRDTPKSRAEVIDGVSKSLRLSKDRRPLVARQLDRMLQRGEILVLNGSLVAADHLAAAHRAARVVRDRQWRQLEDAISARLVAVGLKGGSLERTLRSVTDSAGVLMLNAAATTSAAIEPGGDVGPAKSRIRRTLRRLEADLLAARLDDSRAAQLVIDLTDEISKSEIGQNLLAGDLFLSLLNMETPALLKALGGSGELEVFLDTSVAIPMLAGLLYEPHDERFFQAASYAYGRAVEHGIQLRLPEDYLEEAASHLLEAYERYQPLLSRDPHLRHSHNAFVAHYLSLRHERELQSSFTSYAQSFGLRPFTIGERDWNDERNWIMGRMRTLFSRYDIAVVEPGVVPREALKGAQEAILYTARELDLDRAGRLLEHDARAVADISARAAAGNHPVMFCTWDRLHLQLRTAGGSVEWNALDPVMLGDILALVAEEDDHMSGEAVHLALELREADAHRGAQIWDELIRIERDQFYDADLLDRAVQFKSSYLEAVKGSASTEPLAVAWSRWKAR